jgi:putative aldouronate transport system substrate-binding protein
MPTMKEFPDQKGVIFNKTIAQELGIVDGLYDVKTLEELTPYFDQYLAKYPKGAAINLTVPSDITNVYCYGWTPYTVYFDDDLDKYAVGYESTHFADYLALVRDWAEKGYITQPSEDPFQTKDGWLVWFASTKPGLEEERNPALMLQYGYEYGQSKTAIVPQVMTQESILGACTSLARASENPEAAVYLYEMICIDPVLTNLINFGIEGTHYTKDADGYIDLVANSGYYPAVNWYLGNRVIDYPLKGEPKDLGEQYVEFNNAAITLKNFGFDFDSSKFTRLDLLNGVIQNVRAQYEEQVARGLASDELIAEMAAKLDEVGIHDYCDELNRQYEEWKSGK